MNLNLSQQIRELFLPCLLEGGVVDLAGDYQAEARVELIFPAEIEGDHAQRVVEVLRAGMGHLRGATLMGAANDYRAPARIVTSFTTYLGRIAGRQTRGSRHPGFNAPRGSGAPPATIPPAGRIP